MTGKTLRSSDDIYALNNDEFIGDNQQIMNFVGNEKLKNYVSLIVNDPNIEGDKNTFLYYLHLVGENEDRHDLITLLGAAIKNKIKTPERYSKIIEEILSDGAEVLLRKQEEEKGPPF